MRAPGRTEPSGKPTRTPAPATPSLRMCEPSGLQCCVVVGPAHAGRRWLCAPLPEPARFMMARPVLSLSLLLETRPRPSRGELAAATMAHGARGVLPLGIGRRPRVSVPVPPHHGSQVSGPAKGNMWPQGGGKPVLVSVTSVLSCVPLHPCPKLCDLVHWEPQTPRHPHCVQLCAWCGECAEA